MLFPVRLKLRFTVVRAVAVNERNTVYMYIYVFKSWLKCMKLPYNFTTSKMSKIRFCIGRGMSSPSVSLTGGTTDKKKDGTPVPVGVGCRVSRRNN